MSSHTRLSASALPLVVVFLLAAGSVSQVLAVSTRVLLNPSGIGVDDWLGFAVSSAGDFNGDGYDDVVFGAPQNNSGGANAGQAYMLFGGPGADNFPELIFTGENAFDRFGDGVAYLRDFNGDGYNDIVIGARVYNAGAGRIYLYYGGPGADNVADVLFDGTGPDGDFGEKIACAGDVNGDGYSDLIVGEHHDDTAGLNAGQALVYFGGPSGDNTADLTLPGPVAGDEFGFSVSGAGDVNGDGYDDFLVGTQLGDVVYLYHGAPTPDTTADLVISGEALSAFGQAVSGAGDVNGDGYDDCLIGAQSDTTGVINTGRAYLFHGGPGMDGVADLDFGGEGNGDRFGEAVSGDFDANADGYADLIIGANRFDNGGANPDAGRAYIYFGGPGADATADIILTGEEADDRFGRAVSAAGDVDGDGHQDVIVGAPFRFGTNTGRIYVHAIYPYQIVSPNGGEQWVAGKSATVSWRGHDVADLAMSSDGGASWSTLAVGVGGSAENELEVTVPGPATGLALLRLTYSGQASSEATSDISDGVFSVVDPVVPPLAAHRLWVAPTGSGGGMGLGNSVSDAGDLNGDGYGDIVVGASLGDSAYVYLGGKDPADAPYLVLAGEGSSDEFGISVSGNGDINGDGYPDLLVGAKRNDAVASEAGRAYLYFGGPGMDAVSDLTLSGEADSDFFGGAVSIAGDLDGDGFDDFLVGATGNNAGGNDAGRVYVYLGGAVPDNTADLVLTGELAGDNLGGSVSGAGDVNGDGYGDIVVAASRSDDRGDNSGKAYVYLGGAVLDGTPDLVVLGEAAGDVFGSPVSGAGDVNGDGFDDVIVGAQNNDAAGSNAGRAYLFHGGPGLDATPDLVLDGESPGIGFGISVSGAGDVNADGYSDFVVGSQLYNSAAGRTYVFYGGPGAGGQHDVVFDGEASSDLFGNSVSGAGDINGDGYDDLITGARLNDSQGGSSGRVYVFESKRYFVTAPNGGETWNVGATETVSWLGGEPADLWLSVDGGAQFTLLRSSVGGQVSNTLSVQVPHLPSRFSVLRVAPSSVGVQGSGESDSLFTIEASVVLLNLAAVPSPDGGILLSWGTNPGPEKLVSYKIERSPSGQDDWRVLTSMLKKTEYLDASGTPGMRYRLTAVDGLGRELLLGETTLTPRAVLAAWPLPYRGGDLHLSFATSGGRGGGPGATELAVFDVNGRRVRTIVQGDYESGYQTVTWDGRGATGLPVPSGVYFLRAVTSGEVAQIKLVVAR